MQAGRGLRAEEAVPEEAVPAEAVPEEAVPEASRPEPSAPMAAVTLSLAAGQSRLLVPASDAVRSARRRVSGPLLGATEWPLRLAALRTMP